MKDVEQNLIATALPYWETEAAIVRRFFQSKPTRQDHIFWLKAQLWKELHPVDGYFTGLQKELNNLAASFPEIDKTIGRHQYHSLLEQLTQEFNHYVLMADVLEYLLSHAVFAEDTFQLPQEKTRRSAPGLRQFGIGRRSSRRARHRGRRRADVSRRKKAKRRPARKNDRQRDGGRLSRREDYKDAAREAARAVRTKQDLARMKKAVREVSLQRVHMRNEMFKAPLTSEEIKSCLASHGH